MNLTVQIGLVTGVLMLVASGCSTTGCGCAFEDTAVRGQSPDIQHATGLISEPESLHIQQVGGHHNGEHLAEVRGTIHNHFHGNNVTWHGDCPTGRCPEYYTPGAYCPTYCPPGHHGLFRKHHCQGHGCVKHYQTYQVQRPNDLRYPMPNQPGGAVTYPYYTHKGPDDFFKKD